MLKMLIDLVELDFLCTFVVGKIIYNKKCTYLHRQVHFIVESKQELNYSPS